jgi:RNA polymerase sigma-70 factor (ECF subfamily)
MIPDQELMSGIRDGSQEAFAGLYHRYKGRLYQYALSLLRSREAAEDVLHDVFVGLAGRAGAVPDRVSPFLYAAVRNRSFDLMRKRAEVSSDRIDPELVAAPPGDLELIEQRQLVNRLLLALPDDQREVIVLRTYHDLGFREIAALQGTSVSTALSRYQYGLNRLRKELADDGTD